MTNYLGFREANNLLQTKYGIGYMDATTIIKNVSAGKPTRIPRSLDKLFYSPMERKFYIERPH